MSFFTWNWHAVLEDNVHAHYDPYERISPCTKCNNMLCRSEQRIAAGLGRLGHLMNTKEWFSATAGSRGTRETAENGVLWDKIDLQIHVDGAPLVHSASNVFYTFLEIVLHNIMNYTWVTTCIVKTTEGLCYLNTRTRILSDSITWF